MLLQTLMMVPKFVATPWFSSSPTIKLMEALDFLYALGEIATTTERVQ